MRVLPKGWAEVSLEEVARVQTGLAKNGEKAPVRPVTLPYLRVANVQDGHLDLSEVKTIVADEADVPRYSLADGDVLLTEGGDFDKLGRGCVWRSPIPRCLHQNHVFAVRPNQSRVLADYLAAYCGSAEGKRYFLSCSKQTTNLASINSSQLKSMPLPLPPLAEQRRIVVVLGAWDQAIATIENLITAKRRIFSGLMTRYAHAFHDERVEFGELVDLMAERVQPETCQQPNMSVELENIEANTGRLLGRRPLSDTSALRSRFQAGDTLYGRLRPYLRKFARPNFSGLCSTEIWVLRANPKKLWPPLLFYIVQTAAFNAAAAKQSGSRMPRADWDLVSMAPVPLPNDLARQAEWATLLDTAYANVEPELQRLGQLRTQKRILMQKLLTGEWRLDERFDLAALRPGLGEAAE